MQKMHLRDARSARRCAHPQFAPDGYDVTHYYFAVERPPGYSSGRSDVMRYKVLKILIKIVGGGE
jgi:hypothetical protein